MIATNNKNKQLQTQKRTKMHKHKTTLQTKKIANKNIAELQTLKTNNH